MQSLANVNLGTHRTAIAISAGGYHTCALLHDHTVKCWGTNGAGQLGYDSTAVKGNGNGNGNNMHDLQAVNLGSGKTALAIQAGTSHTCALLNDFTTKCWGHGGSGRLGQDSTDKLGNSAGDMASLGAINLGQAAVAVSPGHIHTCAQLSDGTFKCWGNGEYGRLGSDGTEGLGNAAGEMAALGTVPVTSGIGVIAISAGGAFTCALLSEGSVKCFGRCTDGECGRDSTVNQGDGAGEMAALGAIALGQRAVAISAGLQHACALLADGTVKCWGNGGIHQRSNRRLAVLLLLSFCLCLCSMPLAALMVGLGFGAWWSSERTVGPWQRCQPGRFGGRDG